MATAMDIDNTLPESTTLTGQKRKSHSTRSRLRELSPDVSKDTKPDVKSEAKVKRKRAVITTLTEYLKTQGKSINRINKFLDEGQDPIPDMDKLIKMTNKFIGYHSALKDQAYELAKRLIDYCIASRLQYDEDSLLYIMGAAEEKNSFAGDLTFMMKLVQVCPTLAGSALYHVVAVDDVKILLDKVTKDDIANALAHILNMRLPREKDKALFLLSQLDDLDVITVMKQCRTQQGIDFLVEHAGVSDPQVFKNYLAGNGGSLKADFIKQFSHTQLLAVIVNNLTNSKERLKKSLMVLKDQIQWKDMIFHLTNRNRWAEIAIVAECRALLLQ